MMEPRPSVFKRGWAILWERPAAYALLVILPYLLILGLTILIGRFVVHFHPPAVEQWDPITLWRSMAWGTRLLIILAMMASATVPTYLAARGICRMALAQQRDLEISLGSVLVDMLRFLPVAVLYFLVLGIITFLGGLFLVVPGLLITAGCALIIPAGIDSQLGPLAAIRRGISLVRRVYGRVLGVYASYLALILVGRVALTAFIDMTGDEGSTPTLFVLLGLWFLAALLAMAQVDIMCALFYCEAREMDVAPMAVAAPGDGDNRSLIDN
jgi:hypothetical protein